MFFQAAVTTVFAQDKPKAGDTISGIISDKYGPAMMVNVKMGLKNGSIWKIISMFTANNAVYV